MTPETQNDHKGPASSRCGFMQLQCPTRHDEHGVEDQVSGINNSMRPNLRVPKIQIGMEGQAQVQHNSNVSADSSSTYLDEGYEVYNYERDSLPSLTDQNTSQSSYTDGSIDERYASQQWPDSFEELKDYHEIDERFCYPFQTWGWPMQSDSLLETFGARDFDCDARDNTDTRELTKFANGASNNYNWLQPFPHLPIFNTGPFPNSAWQSKNEHDIGRHNGSSQQPHKPIFRLPTVHYEPDFLHDSERYMPSTEFGLHYKATSHMREAYCDIHEFNQDLDSAMRLAVDENGDKGPTILDKPGRLNEIKVDDKRQNDEGDGNFDIYHGKSIPWQPIGTRLSEQSTIDALRQQALLTDDEFTVSHSDAEPPNKDTIHVSEPRPSCNIRSLQRESTQEFQAGVNLTPQNGNQQHQRLNTHASGDSSVTSDESSETDVLFEWDVPNTIHHRLKLAVLGRLIKSYVLVNTRGSEFHQMSEHNTPNTQHGASASNTTNSKGSTASSNKPGKRKIDDLTDDENEEHKRPLRSTNKHEIPETSKRLACPFYKKDPSRYQHCRTKRLPNISRVKLHLRRCHQIPIHCDRCSMVFADECARSEHLRREMLREITDRVEWDAVSEDQQKELSRRLTSKNSVEDNWYYIYSVLFPDIQPPASPYLNGIENEELMNIFNFAEREGPRIINDLTSVLPKRFRIQPEDLNSFMHSTYQDFLSVLFERWESSSKTDLHRLATLTTTHSSSERPSTQPQAIEDNAAGPPTPPGTSTTLSCVVIGTESDSQNMDVSFTDLRILESPSNPLETINAAADDFMEQWASWTNEPFIGTTDDIFALPK